MVRMFFFSDGRMAIWKGEHLLTTLGKRSSSTQSRKVNAYLAGNYIKYWTRHVYIDFVKFQAFSENDCGT